jgi:hypothetical protein
MRITSLRFLPLLTFALAACLDSTGSDAGPPAAMQIMDGDLQSAPVATELPNALVVRVVDDRGRPVRGEVVNFRVLAGSGTVFAGSAQTNANGEARERWTLGIVAGDTQRVEVRAVDAATGEARTYAVFRAVGTPGPAAEVWPVESSTRGALPNTTVAESLAVYVKDAYNNLVPGATVTWSVRPGGGSISPVQSTAGASGVARAAWTMGTDVLQWAEARTGASAPWAFRGTTQFQPWRLTPQQTGTPGAALADSTRIQVTESSGQGYVSSLPVQWTVVSGGGSVSPTQGLTGTAGVASTRWTLGTSGEQRLRATVAPGVFIEHVAVLAQP